jgi:hypothetical protein
VPQLDRRTGARFDAGAFVGWQRPYDLNEFAR